MCHSCGETVDYLLLYYEKAHRLWSFVFKPFRILWVQPKTILGLLFGWWNWLGKHSPDIWNLVPLCLLWSLWKEHNRWTFENMDSFVDQLFSFFSGSLFNWSRAQGLTSSNSFPSFLCSFLFCNQFYSLRSFLFVFICTFWFALCPFCMKQPFKYKSFLLNPQKKKRKKKKKKQLNNYYLWHNPTYSKNEK